MLGITINCGSVSIVPQPSVAKRLIEAAYRSGLSKRLIRRAGETLTTIARR
jgi:hypothetical protein